MSIYKQNKYVRTPRHYSGVQPTAKPIDKLLPALLHGIEGMLQDKPAAILSAWPELIGKEFSSMTRAVSFVEGVLTVRVKNSTLHSLLEQHEKKRLLSALKKKFPSIMFRTIIFRIGN